MFPNWTGWKTVKIILGAMSALSASLATANPGTPLSGYANVAGVILGSLITLVVMLSGTNLGPTVTK